MGKFEKQAQELLDAIGGKENISAVTHCATRMRFVLNDDAKADKKRIENISTTKGMFTNAGQFQVIIGNDVATFYNDFSAISGIEGVSKEAAKSAAKSNQNVVQRLVGTLSEIFTPLLPAIIVGGLILGFRNILEGVQFGGSTIVENSQFWAGVNGFLWLPGEAIFHFLPVGIAWSVTRKMGTTQILGIVLGITLVSPQLLNAYAVNGTSAAEIAKNWSCRGRSVHSGGGWFPPSPRTACRPRLRAGATGVRRGTGYGPPRNRPAVRRAKPSPPPAVPAAGEPVRRGASRRRTAPSKPAAARS